MPYASELDIRFYYPRVETSGFTSEEMQGFIRRADAVIDTYLNANYSVPLTVVPEIIKQISVDLALASIFDRSPTSPEWLIRLVERAQDLLKAFADGSLTLPGVNQATDTGIVRSNTDKANYVPVFGAIPSLNERFDPQRALDEDNDRFP